MAQKSWSLIVVLVIRNAKWVTMHRVLPAVVVHVFNPNTFGAEADGALSLHSELQTARATDTD